ncbi:MBL fold metallo-hydrolase [Mariprofundus ferrooxydans]|nr:MBL fold metallo-hydrolase [Mariprofundus ferrooxydans]
MKSQSRPLLTLACMFILLLHGCALTHHPVEKAAIGKPCSSAEMERLIDQPGPITLETINSADWSAPLSGLLNLNSPAAVQAGVTDRDEPVHIYAHLLKHPQYGNYLVDTGVSRKVLNDPGKAGLNWIVQKAMHIDKMHINKSTGEILHDTKLSGVFFSHLHLDHIIGMPDIANDVPLYIGASESTHTTFKHMFVQGATDQLFQDKQPFQEWPFQPDSQHRFEGIVDVFGDGSLFAISVSGHTAGSTAYLVRTTHGPVLLAGDTCITRWGWDHTVEPGDFTEDHAHNLQNLKRLKDLVARHPQIDVRLGHQP